MSSPTTGGGGQPARPTSNPSNPRPARTRFKHNVANLPPECVFETRSERGTTDKKSQFETTVDGLKNYVRTEVSGKEGKAFLLHILENDNEDFTSLEPILKTNPTTIEKKMYDVAVDQYCKELVGLANGKLNLAGTILKICSSRMLAKLHTKDDHSSIINDGDVLNLLAHIREISTAFEEHLYRPMSLAAAIQQFLTTYQRETPLDEFVKTFNAQRQTINDFGGSTGIHPILVCKHLNITVSEYKQKKGPMWDKINKLTADSSMNDEYVKGFAEGIKQATAMMRTNHDAISEAERKAVEEFEAVVLLKNAHKQRYETLIQTLSDNLAMGKNTYPTKTSQAFHLLTNHAGARTGVQLFQAHQPTPTNSQAEDAHAFQFFQGGLIDPDWIILDTGSTNHVFGNGTLLTDLHDAPDNESCTLHTNAGTFTTQMRGTYGAIPHVWYNKSAIANVLSLSRLLQSFRVSFDQDTMAFHVTLREGNTLVFAHGEPGLFYYKHNVEQVEEYSFLQTVPQKLQGFTRRQQRQIQLAKETHATLGYPSNSDYLRTVTHQLVRDLPVDIDDVKNYLAVYGHNEAVLQGKTTNHTPAHVPASRLVPVPPDLLRTHGMITLCTDIFYVDGLPFLLCVSRHIRFYNLVSLPTRFTLRNDVLPVLQRIVALYTFRGFRIDSLHADNQFQPLVVPLLAQGVQVHLCPPNGHVPEAERGIRTVKERARCIQAGLPYERYPRLLKRYVVSAPALSLNMLPHPDGVSPTLSPRTIVTGQHTSYTRHCRISVGAFCHLHDPHTPTNTMEPRTFSGIALGPDHDSPQTRYFFMSLQTGARVSRARWTTLTLTADTVARVHQLADAEHNHPIPVPDPFLFE